MGKQKIYFLTIPSAVFTISIITYLFLFFHRSHKTCSPLSTFFRNRKRKIPKTPFSNVLEI